MKSLFKDPVKNLYTLLIVLLFIPWIQSAFNVIGEKPLQGGIVKKPIPLLNEVNWFEARFQLHKEESLNENFGFRNSFVRLHNQLDYYLFDKVHAQSVIRGKNNVLFEYNYIKAYYGLDYIGVDSIRNRLIRIKSLQDEFRKQDKSFVLVLAASKGQFYPEFFPDSIQYNKNTTNYESHISIAKELGINYIDFNAWFLSMKDTSSYMLYPPYGIHWTHYGACLVSDSLIHFIERNQQMDLPEMMWERIRMAPALYDDNDIEKGLNLLFPLSGPDYPYPQYHFESPENKQLPNVAVIADSYYWSLFNLGIHKSFNKNRFLFYNRELYEPGYVPVSQVNSTNSLQIIAESQVIFMMATDANLPHLGWGFLDTAEDYIHQGPQVSVEFQEKVRNLMNYIPTDEKWMKHIREKAQNMKLTVDSVIRMDAEWMIQEEMKRK